MGHIRHDAIIVTSWDYERALSAHQHAKRIGCTVTPMKDSPVNHYRTFVVVPDGSKEGWETSDLGDFRRAALIEWLRARRYEDGSSALEWCAVSYGNDDATARIVDHEWSDERPTPEPQP